MTAATRVSRRATVRRRRAVAGVAALVVVAVAAYGVSRLGDAEETPGGAPAEGTGDRSSDLLVLQVTGTQDPLFALVGTRRAGARPAFFSLPFDLTMTVPGQGDVAARDVAELDAEALRVAVSNTFGAWAGHVAVLDLEGLAAAVDRTGGLRVRVPGVFETEEGRLGPGVRRLSGPQVAALLRVEDDGGEARWATVLQALFRRPLRLVDDDLAQTDGLRGVRRVLRGARGATIASFPTVFVAGSVLVPRQPDLDRQVARLYGYGEPVPVIVENGVGAPGLGQDVAAALVPLGFRVVVSQNADAFGYERTRVVANGSAAVADARRIREALGVGRVGVSEVPSGIGDITIIVGEDFTG